MKAGQLFSCPGNYDYLLADRSGSAELGHALGVLCRSSSTAQR
jgi:hypothetical protein